MRTNLEFGNPEVYEPHCDECIEEDVADQKVEEAKHRMKVMVKENPTVPAPTLYENVCLEMNHEDPVTASRIPGFHHVDSALYRARASLLPNVPTSLDQLQLPLPEQFGKIDGGQFFWFDAENRKILAFSTRKNLKRLCRAKIIKMDGTFKSCPTLFTQLFSMHIDKGIKSLPAAYFLMQNRSTLHYRVIFNRLKQWATNNGREFKPDVIRIDFESGTIKAIKQELPTSRISGCFFHFGQAVWRKIQNLGLADLYRTNKPFNRRCRLLLAIAFLPPDQISAQFESVVENCPAELLNDFNRLAAYFRDYWIPRAELFSVHGVKQRTNNSIEGWNARFHRRLNRQIHSPFWTFMKMLVREQKYTEFQISQIKNQIDVNRPNPDYVKRDEQLDGTIEQFEAGDLSVNQFLLRVVHLIGDPAKVGED